MSNQTEIERLGGARNKIRKKLVSMGVAQDTDKLDALAEKLDAIPILHGVQEVLDVNNPRCSIPAGYYGGEGEVGIALEEKTVTPTDTQQIITPSAGKVLSKVTVEAAESGGGGGSSPINCGEWISCDTIPTTTVKPSFVSGMIAPGTSFYIISVPREVKAVIFEEANELDIPNLRAHFVKNVFGNDFSYAGYGVEGWGYDSTTRELYVGEGRSLSCRYILLYQ